MTQMTRRARSITQRSHSKINEKEESRIKITLITNPSESEAAPNMKTSTPSTIVLMRTLRPYFKVFTALAWIYIRLIRQDSKEEFCLLLESDDRNANTTSFDSGADNHAMECQRPMFSRGLFDHIQNAFTALTMASTHYISKQTGSTFLHRFASTLCLYTNDFLGMILIIALLQTIQKMQNYSLTELKEQSIQSVFDFAKVNISFVRKELIKEEVKMEKSLKESLWKGRKQVTRVLPKRGIDVVSVLADLTSRAELENKRWENGLVSGTVYGGEKSHTELLNKVYSLYSLSNPLHPDIWPSINQCEAEVISMTANLLNGGDKNVVGCMTSGGTESIVMAVRAHLQLYGKKRGIKSPEIISGDTAHAGLNKACEMFGIRLIQVPCNERTYYKIDAKEVERQMSMNVIMIYSSAPNYPQGVIDPIEDLSNLAMKYGIGLHVDACLGGFVLPFARMLNYNVPNFDFGWPGVTSMSADTHKYGYACKGTSVVLYRNKNLRSAQYFNYSKWTGGLYCTPTIAGSRAGGLIACAWASLTVIGEEGFKSRVKLIMDATQEISRGVAEIKGLKLLGCDPNPDAMIVCFSSADGYDLDIYQVAEAMSKENWSLNSLQNPASIHLCVTLKTVEYKMKFISDLKKSIEELLRNPTEKKEGGSAAIYGATGSMPAGPVNELLKVYTDVTLSC